MPYYPDMPWESNRGTLLDAPEAEKSPVSADARHRCHHVFEEDGEGDLVCVLCGQSDREWSEEESGLTQT